MKGIRNSIVVSSSKAAVMALAASISLCFALFSLAGPASASTVTVEGFSAGPKKPTQVDLAKGTLIQDVKIRTKGGSLQGLRVPIKASLLIKQPWSKTVKAGSSTGTYRVGKGGVVEVRVRLNAAGLELARNCGAPKVTLNVAIYTQPGYPVVIGGKNPGGNVQTRARAQGSRCAVPANVKTAVQRSKSDGCDFIAPARNACMAPFPNDFYTRKDPSSETGIRVDLDPNATPADAGGKHIAVEELNRSDGFSPGPLLTVQIPGMDNQEAFDESGLVPLAAMSRTYEPDQAVVLIDAETGQRQLIWAELDSYASADSARHLLIRPGKNLENGKRYIVALRNLKNAQGKILQAPAAFRLYRDGKRTNERAIESRRAKFESIFRTLADEGVSRKSLYLAWDFTVASTENLTGRMTSIRDRAFAALGDSNLTDGVVDGEAPEFVVDKVLDDDASLTGSDAALWSNARNELERIVEGRVTVPCYLWQDATTPGCQTGSKFKLDDDQKPIRGGETTYQAKFICNIPKSAVEGGEVAPVPTSLYGHGLFGQAAEAKNSRNVRQLGDENGVMVCAADWIGMSEEDVLGAAVPALVELSKFSALPDRLQQGFLNWLFLGRAIIHEDGLATHPAFQVDPDGDGPTEAESVIDRSDLFYYGNSQGGIAGGALTAVATDFTRSVLYVGGINYSMLLSRSSHWDTYASILYNSYMDETDHPVIFSVMQMLWDRGEPNGYANHMTDDPLPGTPEHKVMYAMAYGDFQVANVTTEVGARTIGAPLRLPAVAPERLTTGLIEPFYGHETLGDLASSADARNGNAFFIWDIGPKRAGGLGVNPPPLTNLPPDEATAGQDPHDYVIEKSPIIRKQIADFLKAPGQVTDPCTGVGESDYCTANYLGKP
jgi:hypothetical protein